MKVPVLDLKLRHPVFEGFRVTMKDPALQTMINQAERLPAKGKLLYLTSKASQQLQLKTPTALKIRLLPLHVGKGLKPLQLWRKPSLYQSA